MTLTRDILRRLHEHTKGDGVVVLQRPSAGATTGMYIGAPRATGDGTAAGHSRAGTLFAQVSGMETNDWLGVTNDQALKFFFEHLRDVTDDQEPPRDELLYNASVLAHFATTSTASSDAFPASPAALDTIFELFVLDRSQHTDAGIMEAAASQCLLLTGFFQDQQRRRHHVDWYASLGTAFYLRAAAHSRDRSRSRMMETMAHRFGFWRSQQHRLAHELHDQARMIAVPPAATGSPLIM
jgi:hypothetical protein